MHCDQEYLVATSCDRTMASAGSRGGRSKCHKQAIRRSECTSAGVAQPCDLDREFNISGPIRPFKSCKHPHRKDLQHLCHNTPTMEGTVGPKIGPLDLPAEVNYDQLLTHQVADMSIDLEQNL